MGMDSQSLLNLYILYEEGLGPLVLLVNAYTYKWNRGYFIVILGLHNFSPETLKAIIINNKHICSYVGFDRLVGMNY